LFEPNIENIEKCKQNLIQFKDRYDLELKAVSDFEGDIQFGIESTGRYGGIGLNLEKSITVRCKHINSVLAETLSKCGIIDVLKIDTEGVEVQTVKAIANEYKRAIRNIFIEAAPKEDLIPDVFSNRQYGTVRRLIQLPLL
jgi:FkbM family methyltransferase